MDSAFASGVGLKAIITAAFIAAVVTFWNSISLWALFTSIWIIQKIGL